MMAGAIALYEEAMREQAATLILRTADGRALPLQVSRWCGPPDAADEELLRHCHGPVLDVGCGPGRLTVALTERGIPALGVDISGTAVARVRRAGATALHRSVFDPLPGEGRWATVLLADGNIGIGGQPARPAAAALRPAGGARRPDPCRSRARQRRRAADRMAGTPRRPARPGLPLGPHGHGRRTPRCRRGRPACHGAMAARRPHVRPRGPRDLLRREAGAGLVPAPAVIAPGQRLWAPHAVAGAGCSRR